MSTSPIEEYLDTLYAAVRADPGTDARSARRLLDEAADHLHSAADEFETGGLDRAEAEQAAVRGFGPSGPLARADRQPSFGRLVVDTGYACTVLGGIGLVAVGVSGVVAGAMSALFGQRFVGAALARSIAGEQTSVAESAHDALALRALAGIVGVAVLAVAWFARSRGLRLRVLPASYVDTVGLVAFTAATLVLGALSIVQVVQQHGNGIGFFLSGALVSIVGAAGFGVRAVRTVLHTPS
jgi:hypothetical protein